MKKILRKIYLMNRDNNYFYLKQLLYIAFLYFAAWFVGDGTGLWKLSSLWVMLFRVFGSLMLLCYATSRLIGLIITALAHAGIAIHGSGALRNMRKNLKNKIEKSLDIKQEDK